MSYGWDGRLEAVPTLLAHMHPVRVYGIVARVHMPCLAVLASKSHSTMTCCQCVAHCLHQVLQSLRRQSKTCTCCTCQFHISRIQLHSSFLHVHGQHTEKLAPNGCIHFGRHNIRRGQRGINGKLWARHKGKLVHVVECSDCNSVNVGASERTALAFNLPTRASQYHSEIWQTKGSQLGKIGSTVSVWYEQGVLEIVSPRGGISNYSASFCTTVRLRSLQYSKPVNSKLA